MIHSINTFKNFETLVTKAETRKHTNFTENVCIKWHLRVISTSESNARKLFLKFSKQFDIDILLISISNNKCLKYFSVLKTKNLILKLHRISTLTDEDTRNILETIDQTDNFYCGLNFNDWTNQRSVKINSRSFLSLFKSSKLKKIAIYINSFQISQSSVHIKRLVKLSLLYTTADIKITGIIIPFLNLEEYTSQHTQRISFSHGFLPLCDSYLLLKRCGTCIKEVIALSMYQQNFFFMKQILAEFVKDTCLTLLSEINFQAFVSRTEEILKNYPDKMIEIVSFLKLYIKPDIKSLALRSSHVSDKSALYEM